MDDDITVLNAPDKMTFAWWNTSLSPATKSRNIVDMQEFALNVITYMITVLKADFIALGEVSKKDFEFFEPKNKFPNYKYVSSVTEKGKGKVDLGYIYNTETIAILDDQPIIEIIGRTQHKIAQRVLLNIIDHDTPVTVFISHWPGRMFVDNNSPKRHALSITLRRKVDEILAIGPEAIVVLLGDYNDEPYNVSLSDHLRASRDREFVKKNPHLLYNPFWSFLGDLLSKPTDLGSYYYSSGETTRWYAFDQMIFSHGLIRGKKWILSDASIYVAKIPELLEKVTSSKHKFDHLPIFGTIEKV